MSQRTTSISPLLNVHDGAAAIDFYQRAFGATVLSQTPPDSGSVVARLAIDGADFWVADESLPHGNPSPRTLNGSTVRIIIETGDPDGVTARAVAAGATLIVAVADMDYGWRMGRVADPFGHHWEIGRPLQPAP